MYSFLENLQHGGKGGGILSENRGGFFCNETVAGKVTVEDVQDNGLYAEVAHGHGGGVHLAAEQNENMTRNRSNRTVTEPSDDGVSAGGRQ